MHARDTILYQTWTIQTKLPVDINFVIRQFSGLTADRCAYGGYALTIMTNESNSRSILEKGTPRLKLDAHGPFCWSAPNVPFIGGKIQSVTLPYGVHRLTVYAYSDLFNIDITVSMRRGECTSITNICPLAQLRLRRDGYKITEIHNHIDFTELRLSHTILGRLSNSFAKGDAEQILQV